jgi:preprotein translocase SecE subunit
MSFGSSFGKFSNYLKGVVREGKLISWPSKEQAGFQFIVVVVLSALLTVLLYVIDIALAAGIQNLKALIVK